MANRQRGEVLIDIDGTQYTIVLDINTCCEVESLFHPLTYTEIGARIQKGSMTHLRGLVWAGLQRHHKGFTVEQAGELIHKVGGVDAFATKLHEAVMETNPDPKDLSALGVTADPPKAQAANVRSRGTGTRSTVPPAASA